MLDTTNYTAITQFPTRFWDNIEIKYGNYHYDEQIDKAIVQKCDTKSVLADDTYYEHLDIENKLYILYNTPITSNKDRIGLVNVTEIRPIFRCTVSSIPTDNGIDRSDLLYLLDCTTEQELMGWIRDFLHINNLPSQFDEQ